MEIYREILKDSNDFEEWYKKKEKEWRYICNTDTTKPLHYPCLIVWLIAYQDVEYDFIYPKDIKDLLL